MTARRDLLVIGGGPAGVEAAVAAAGAGLGVVLVDEAPAADGRVRKRLAASGVDAVFDHAVWSVSPGFRVDALGPGGSCSWTGRAVIAATGAHERIVPFPGWTEPGVIGFGAALLPSSGLTRTGRRILVAGCGPQLYAVAAGLIGAGATVAAIVDLAAVGDWARLLPALARRPDLLMRGAGWLMRARRAGVPILSRHALRRVTPSGAGLDAVVGRVDGAGRPVDAPDLRFAVDGVAVGHGLTPSSDVTRLLRASHHFDPRRGGWVAGRDRDGRTSVPGLSVAGDGGGIAGAAAAALDGRLAGLAVARDLGALTPEAHALETRPLRRGAARARRVGEALADMMALRPGQVDAIPADTVVCRCETVTRAAIEVAIADGATSANQLKAWTRCGMGSCQGRICGDVAGAFLARAGGRPEEVGTFTGRTPFRPLSIDALAGHCAYVDIALPPPAPL